MVDIIQKDGMSLAIFKDIDDYMEYSKDSKYNVKDERWAYSRIGKKKTDELLKCGDAQDELIKMVYKIRDEIAFSNLEGLQTSFKSCKRRRVFRDEGSDLDIDRVMSGESEYWSSIKRDGKKEFITLGIQIALSCGNKAKDFAEQTAIALVTCEILESLGYGVEIVCLSSVYSSDTDFVEVGEIFTIKKSEDVTDVRAVASTSLSGLLREYSFKNSQKIIEGHTGYCKVTSNKFLALTDINILIAKQWSNGDHINYIEKIVKEVTE